MSCKFCTDKRCIIEDKTYSIEFSIVERDGRYYLDAVTSPDSNGGEIDINYCPICGERLSDNFMTIQHMQLVKKDYNKLVDKYDKQTVDEVIESMKNYSKLNKYKNAYLTANKWCKKRFKDKDDGWGDIE